MTNFVSTSIAGKYNLFNQMKIGVRVGLSFFVILSIIIATSLFNLEIFSQSEETFFNYSKVSSEAVAILDIDRQVSELQQVILAYSNTGNDGIIVRAKESHKILVDSLTEFKNSIANEANLTLLNNMTKKLVSYGEYIDAIAESRKQRDRLIDESMILLADDSAMLIAGLKKIARQGNDTGILEQTHLISEHLLKSRMDAISFLGNRKYSFQKSSINALNLAKEKTIALYQSEALSFELNSLLQKLLENISTYEKNFYQTIQATRDYLFLVNVVMAGEAKEFTTLSMTLKNSTLSTLDLFTESTKERLDNARKITTYVTTGAITIGVILAFLISQSLSRPIREISETFKKLVSGKHDTEIPGLNRSDEIGQLATAANVFKQMNERTNEILKKSQTLADELRLRENQLKDRTISLQKSNDELDNFAYVASHDLKSPLRGIDNLCQWIKEDCGSILPEESRHHLDKMQQRVNRMENLLTGLLNYSRVGRMDVEIEEIDTVTLVKNVVDFISKPEKFIIHISEDLPKITTQVSPLQQVFLNLITNAINYSDKEDGLVIVTSKQLNEDFVEFSVADNGPGIDPKFHERIFQMFQTLQPRDVIESSGMGLAIIKKVVEGQGGQITLESTLGKGCIFKFSWPLNTTIISKVA